MPRGYCRRSWACDDGAPTGSSERGAPGLAAQLTLAGLLGVVVAALAMTCAPGRLVRLRSLTRAALQLAVVAGLVWATFVLFMLGAVAVAAGHRLEPGARHVGQVLVTSAAGTAPVLLLLLGPGDLPRTHHLVSFVGIVFGGTMSACTRAGARLRERVADRWTEFEAWLTLGASRRQAVLPLVAGRGPGDAAAGL